MSQAIIFHYRYRFQNFRIISVMFFAGMVLQVYRKSWCLRATKLHIWRFGRCTLSLQWAGPAQSIKPGSMENCPKIVKKTILMDSGGSPENCRKIVKMTKIDRFGGPSGNCQTIVLGRLIIVKKMSKSCPRTIVLQFFWQTYGPKEGRRPKAATPLLGAAGGRDHFFVKKM